MTDATRRKIDGVMGRTRLIAEMDKNQVRRAAKLEILKLLELDMNATLDHH